MIRKTVFTAMLVALAAATVSAQDPRVEISGTAGWTFSDGVTGDGVTVPGIGVFDSIGPKDAFSWGPRIGFNVTPNVEVGFLFDQTVDEVRARRDEHGRSRRRERLQLPRLLRLQLRRVGRLGAPVHPRRGRGDAIRLALPMKRATR